jgi:hypothetical protein
MQIRTSTHEIRNKFKSRQKNARGYTVDRKMGETLTDRNP